MVYLDSFTFPDGEDEFDFRLGIKRTCYASFYPMGVLSQKGLRRLDFTELTLLCGGNGSGKTTALNLIGEKLKLKRESPFNRTSFFDDYLNLCSCEKNLLISEDSRVVTSDDVFDYMLSVRELNEGVDKKREEVFQTYLTDKYADFHFKTMEDFERLKKVNEARRTTQSKYTKAHLIDNVRTFSNGESAFRYFTEKVKEDALYLLDEPENSLSGEMQQKLAAFLEESVRYAGCQLIIATHSPYLLGMRGAKIYDLDETPVTVKKWTEIKSVRRAYDFFKSREKEF